MQLVVSDGIPRPECVARINHSWVNQEVVEATAELQLLRVTGPASLGPEGWSGGVDLGAEGPSVVS